MTLDAFSHGAPRWWARRLGLGVGVMVIFLGLYNLVARHPLGSPVDLLTPLDRAIPFMSWTWWLYVPAYAGTLAYALFSLRSVRLMWLTLAALVLCQLVNDVFYVLMPAPFPRPYDQVGGGVTGLAFHLLWSLDPPSNTFPSSHVAVAFIAWRAMRLDKHPRAWVNLAALASILVTVHTAKQHFLADSIAGLVVGWACHRALVPPRDRDRSPNPVAATERRAQNGGYGGEP